LCLEAHKHKGATYQGTQISTFYGYNQVPIAKEDQEKTTFVSEFGSFAYKFMSLGIKNAPAVFSRIMVKAFQEYIYKTMAL
jgi:hypothetical protein